MFHRGGSHAVLPLRTVNFLTAMTGVLGLAHYMSCNNTYDGMGLGQLSNRNRKLKIAGCVTERYHSFARDFDILRPI